MSFFFRYCKYIDFLNYYDCITSITFLYQEENLNDSIFVEPFDLQIPKDWNDSIDKENLLNLESSYDSSLDCGLIVIHIKILAVEINSIKMCYTNGQGNNMQEVELTKKPENIADIASISMHDDGDETLLHSPITKSYEFSLKAIDRNILQNDFTLAVEYSLIRNPGSFSTNFRIEVSFYFIIIYLEQKIIDTLNRFHISKQKQVLYSRKLTSTMKK